jgi:hypothetical protein
MFRVLFLRCREACTEREEAPQPLANMTVLEMERQPRSYSDVRVPEQGGQNEDIANSLYQSGDTGKVAERAEEARSG